MVLLLFKSIEITNQLKNNLNARNTAFKVYNALVANINTHKHTQNTHTLTLNLTIN